MFTPFATPSGKGKSDSTPSIGSTSSAAAYGVYGGAYPTASSTSSAPAYGTGSASSGSPQSGPASTTRAPATGIDWSKMLPGGSYGVYRGAYYSGQRRAPYTGPYLTGIRQPFREPSPSSNGKPGGVHQRRLRSVQAWNDRARAAERRPIPSYARRPPARPLSYQTQLSWIVQPQGDRMPGSFRRPRSPLARLYG